MSEEKPPQGKDKPPRDKAGPARDKESNRLSGRMSRYARVGAGVGGFAAKYAGQRFFGAGFAAFHGHAFIDNSPKGERIDLVEIEEMVLFGHIGVPESGADAGRLHPWEPAGCLFRRPSPRRLSR